MWLSFLWGKEDKNEPNQGTEIEKEGVNDTESLPEKDFDLKKNVYPAPDEAIPAVTTEDIIGSQTALIKELMTAVSMTDEEKNQYLWPVIRQLAAFVHLLPASQSHHHNGRGGLFRHSLETALFAVNIAKNRILDVNANPVSSYHNKSRWYLAIAIAGLLHDAGKCVTDMTITAQAKAISWLPTTETLAKWLIRNQIKDYFCTWNLNRINHQHECAGAILYTLIVPTVTRQYLEESYSSKLKNELYESLAGIRREGAEIANTVIKADSASTKKDISRQLREGFHPGVNSPIVVCLEKIMQQLVETQKWKVNVLNSPLWVTERGIFLIWHRAISSIKAISNSTEFASMPPDPDVWFDKLSCSSLVESRFIEEDTDWAIRSTNWDILPLPEFVESSKNESPLNFQTALKLTDNTLIFANIGKPSPVVSFIEGETLTSKERLLWVKHTAIPVSEYFGTDFPPEVQAPPLRKEEVPQIYNAVEDMLVAEENVFHNHYPYPDVSTDQVLDEISEEFYQTIEDESSLKEVADSDDLIDGDKPPETVQPKDTKPLISENDLLSPSQKAAREKRVKNKQSDIPMQAQSDESTDKHTDLKKHDDNNKPLIKKRKLTSSKIIENLFNEVKTQLQNGNGDLIEGLTYRNDRIYSSTAPIERTLRKHKISMESFIDRLVNYQVGPRLYIDDNRDFIYLLRSEIDEH